MQTYFKNPYQTELETKIIEKKISGNITSLLLEDTLCPLYSKLLLSPERVRIEGKPLMKIEKTRKGVLHFIEGNIDRDLVHMEVIEEDRYKTQKEVSLRLLFYHALRYYFYRKPWSFEQSQEQSAIILKSALRDDLVDRIQSLLELSAKKIIKKGLNLQSFSTRNPETTIFGITTLPWMGPHFFHSAEIGDFHFTGHTSEDDKTLLFYQYEI